MRNEILRNSRILIIADAPDNVRLLEGILREGGYQHWKDVTDSREALAVFSEYSPDLVVLDWRMPHVDGMSVLKEIRSRVPEGGFLPVVLATADASRSAKQDALSLGAKDFLIKPLDVTDVLLRIYNLLETRWLHVELDRYSKSLEDKVRERTYELEEAQLEILRRLAVAAEYRDDCTGEHAQRVGQLAALIGRAIGLADDHVELIHRAAPLHDVGKIGIPDGILLKPGRLTKEEYSKVKTHTDIGRIILSGSKFPVLKLAERIALYHHERWDGSGYYSLLEDEIPLEARIVSVADAFDVITHERPYKAAAAFEDAMAAIQEESGKQFDPALVDALSTLQPMGALAKLGEALSGFQTAKWVIH